MVVWASGVSRLTATGESVERNESGPDLRWAVAEYPSADCCLFEAFEHAIAYVERVVLAHEDQADADYLVIDNWQSRVRVGESRDGHLRWRDVGTFADKPLRVSTVIGTLTFWPPDNSESLSVGESQPSGAVSKPLGIPLGEPPSPLSPSPFTMS